MSARPVTALALLAAAAVSNFAAVSAAQPQAVAPVPAQPAPEETARLEFNRGKAFYAAANFADALVAFRASVAAYPSPTAQLLVARCLRDLGRLGEATLAYEHAVVLAGTQAAASEEYLHARDAAEMELGELARRVGRLRIDLTPAGSGANVRVAGLLLPAAASSRAWPVTPGTIVVEAEAEGARPVTTTLTVRAGEEAQVTLALTPAPPAESPPEVAAPGASAETGGDDAFEALAWGSAGLAVAGAGAFLAFYFLAEGQADDYRAACISRPCSDARQADLATTGETYQALTNVGLVTAAVSAAASVTFFLLAGAGDAQAEGAPNARLSKEGLDLSWRF